MPVPGFLATFADKAQSAIQASPLAAHLPGGNGPRPSSPDSAPQPPANEAAAQGGHRSLALESIQHQLRAFGQQYSSSTTPVQKIITSEKGFAIDFDSVARNSKNQSKELYTWGQMEPEDLKDVTDRLAYLNFVQGSLASSLAVKLNTARTPLKLLRDAETALAPRRNLRAGLQTQLARLEHDQQKGTEKKIVELKDQIRKAELDDEPQEKEVELLKRKAVRESEQLKWEAIREYGEKLVLLSQASAPIISALPTLPPTQAHPYTGAQTTGAARASLQRALDNYKTGHINLPPHPVGSDLSRSDTRSFGESHASELSSIGPGAPSGPHTGATPTAGTSSPTHHPTASSPPISSPPINPATLNQSPAYIPTTTSPHPPASVAPLAIPEPVSSHNAVPVITPTIAETGVPVSAGHDGPGPASGSLHDIRGASSTAGPRSGGLPGNEPHGLRYGEADQLGSAPSIVAPGVAQQHKSAEEEQRNQQPAQGTGTADPTQAPPPTMVGGSSPSYETAEEEKKRLQATYSQSSSAGGPTTQSQAPSAVASSASPSYETAEEEKKRLEREERERILRAGVSQEGSGDVSKKGDEDLPPYQDI